MSEEHRKRILGLGRASPSALRLHDLLKERGVVSLRTAQEALGLSFPTVSKAMIGLAHLGIVREITQRSRERLFSYERYVNFLGRGTEPIRTQ